MNKEFFARKKDIDELQINKVNASDVYTKEEVINKITEKVSEIVADAPEDFDTLKEMSDWINSHEGSAAEMNAAIKSKVDKEEGKSLIKYIKSIGTSKEYSPVSELNFRYIDDDNLFIGGADAAISNVEIISLY